MRAALSVAALLATAGAFWFMLAMDKPAQHGPFCQNGETRRDEICRNGYFIQPFAKSDHAQDIRQHYRGR